MKLIICVAALIFAVFFIVGFVGKMINSIGTYMDDSFRWGGKDG